MVERFFMKTYGINGLSEACWCVCYCSRILQIRGPIGVNGQYVLVLAILEYKTVPVLAFQINSVETLLTINFLVVAFLQ